MVIIINIIVGFLTGVLASMGLGGGFILVVWLTLFMDFGQKAAQGINLLFFLPIAAISLMIHLKNRLVNKKLVKRYAFWGVLGAGLGTFAAQHLSSDFLRMMFALFLLGFGFRELFSKVPEDETKNEA